MESVDRGPVCGAREPRPVFWKELYWFVVICLGGSILAVLVLSPRLARHRNTVDVENSLQRTVTGLARLERQYDAAIQALDTDPFYRDEVIRSVLKVKRNTEEFLKQPSGISDN